jgi:hypothetical protein
VTTDPVDVSGLDNDATVTVTLTTATSGASIYYTLDGSTPTKESTLYEEPFEVTAPSDEGGTVTVKAIGIRSGYTNSAIATKAIIFRAKEVTVSKLGKNYYAAGETLTFTISGLRPNEEVYVGMPIYTGEGGWRTRSFI